MGIAERMNRVTVVDKVDECLEAVNVSIGRANAVIETTKAMEAEANRQFSALSETLVSQSDELRAFENTLVRLEIARKEAETRLDQRVADQYTVVLSAVARLLVKVDDRHRALQISTSGLAGTVDAHGVLLFSLRELSFWGRLRWLLTGHLTIAADVQRAAEVHAEVA